ncbi:UvrABC system protein B [uncultured archaeon]|nr:UvrABC system protein B [uncultured archaeon]
MDFKLVSDFEPKGDQPKAIEELAKCVKSGKLNTLLGVTGSGKTFTVANLIQKLQMPALVISHNKTLAAQLYSEFRGFFPDNAVEFFVSYYDYYQPESYIPQTDTYIEKDASINEKIERMRLSATTSIMSRKDVVVVASVSCIYGLGSPQEYRQFTVSLNTGEKKPQKALVSRLVEMQYERNDTELLPGRFRIRGDTIDIIGGYDTKITRVEFFGNEIEKMSFVNPEDGKIMGILERTIIFPAKHFVVGNAAINRAITTIEQEVDEWAPTLPPLYEERIRTRTKYDLEMIKEIGYCSGIENYSRHFDGRKPGEPPCCLLDFFLDAYGNDFLIIIDESHVTIPQLHGMFGGDWSRKKNLIDYGFRLPSAFDNRPLKFNEFQRFMNRTIFVSATPGDYELKESGCVVEQIIRPTGLVDPAIEVKKTDGQIPDLLKEIQKTTQAGDKVFITTLTKRLAEDLTEYLLKEGVRARYLHSEIATLDRTEIIRALRAGEFDVLVGINLLREGLDVPEVALVAILDADKEGFLRNARSLIQTIGRASRNVRGRVLLYADTMTRSMKEAIGETERRRTLQVEFNKAHNITPKTIVKAVESAEAVVPATGPLDKVKLHDELVQLDAEMKTAAESLDFERAILLRDRIRGLRKGLK